MRHAPWMAGALALSISLSVHATDVEGQGTTFAKSNVAAAPGSPTEAVEVGSTTQTFQQAITELGLERQAFVSAFEWNGGDKSALQAEYSTTMTGFMKRELELKRDYFSAQGRVEELARIQAALERMDAPANHLPEIAREAAAGPAEKTGTLGHEVTQ